jgi:hypothetical protein
MRKKMCSLCDRTKPCDHDNCGWGDAPDPEYPRAKIKDERNPDAMPNEHNTLIGCEVKAGRMYSPVSKDGLRVVHMQFKRIRGGDMHFIVYPWRGFALAWDLFWSSLWSLIHVGNPRKKRV